MHENPPNGQWPPEKWNREHREAAMAEEHKGPNKFDELRGKAKEQAGKVTGNREQEAEGTVEKNKAKLKQAGEKVKDVFTPDEKKR
jgi:uncharacterized protein YjbJ (UPF0337 family)